VLLGGINGWDRGAACGEGGRCVRCLCMPQGGVALSAWGRDGFVTVCGGYGDGGGREGIWSRVASRFVRRCHDGNCFGWGWVLVLVCRGGGDPMKCGSWLIGSWSRP
jgi:hypothetical protein